MFVLKTRRSYCLIHFRAYTCSSPRYIVCEPKIAGQFGVYLLGISSLLQSGPAHGFKSRYNVIIAPNYFDSSYGHRPKRVHNNIIIIVDRRIITVGN